MNTIKLLNIAILAFIITLVLQLFMPKPAQTPTAENYYITTTEKSFVVPNIPQLTVHNTSSGTLTINPCDDISVSVGSANITNISTASPDFCTPLTVDAGTHKNIDFNPLYKIFASNIWQYIVSVNSADFGSRQVTFEMEAPGFWRTLGSILIYEPIYNLFVALFLVLPDASLGWAIIIVTIIIRIILLVPQHKMLKSSQKMATLSPKIRAIQEEYKDKREELGMKLLELYKKEWVSPMGSCLPLLIQLPILMGLYWVVSSVSDKSNLYHLYTFFQNFDPTTINTVFFGQDLLQIGGTTGIIMAIVLMGTQFIQAYLTYKNQPKSPKKQKKESSSDEIPAFDPEIMQKMTLYIFPFMIGITGYFFPLGLGLYWWVGLLFMIAQQFYVNATAKKKPKKDNIEIIPKK